jgi:hypothetical protein
MSNFGSPPAQPGVYPGLITGHSTRQMFDRYNTVDVEDTRQAVSQYQDFLKNVDQTVDQAEKNEN